MEEMKIENELELKVFINGVPDITLMPKEIFDAFISTLELQINGYIKEKAEKKERRCKEV